MIVARHKSIFESLHDSENDEVLSLLREADGDEAPAAGGNDNPPDAQVDQTTTNTDPNAGEAESTSDDDLNVDVDLNVDDPGTGGDADNQDDNGGGDDFGGGGDDSGGSFDSGDSGGSENEKVKKGNTDLFASLTAEEQSIKIMELKKQYNDLYTSLDDLIGRIRELYMNDIDPRILVRVSSQMEDLRRLLQDYIINSFNIKTYYENDVQFSIFLSMFTTLQGVFDDIYKVKERNSDKKN